MINIWEIHEQPLPMNTCIYLCIVVKRRLAQGLVYHQVFANKYWCVNVWCALIDLEDLMFQGCGDETVGAVDLTSGADRTGLCAGVPSRGQEMAFLWRQAVYG